MQTVPIRPGSRFVRGTFLPFVALQKIHIGSLQKDIYENEIVEFDGVIARIRGQEHTLPELLGPLSIPAYFVEYHEEDYQDLPANVSEALKAQAPQAQAPQAQAAPVAPPPPVLTDVGATSPSRMNIQKMAASVQADDSRVAKATTFTQPASMANKPAKAKTFNVSREEVHVGNFRDRSTIVHRDHQPGVDQGTVSARNLPVQTPQVARSIRPGTKVRNAQGELVEVEAQDGVVVGGGFRPAKSSTVLTDSRSADQQVRRAEATVRPQPRPQPMAPGGFRGPLKSAPIQHSSDEMDIPEANHLPGGFRGNLRPAPIQHSAGEENAPPPLVGKPLPVVRQASQDDTGTVVGTVPSKVAGSEPFRGVTAKTSSPYSEPIRGLTAKVSSGGGGSEGIRNTKAFVTASGSGVRGPLEEVPPVAETTEYVPEEGEEPIYNAEDIPDGVVEEELPPPPPKNPPKASAKTLTSWDLSRPESVRVKDAVNKWSKDLAAMKIIYAAETLEVIEAIKAGIIKKNAPKKPAPKRLDA